MNHVKKFPSADTLAEVRSYADGKEPELPTGWERMSDADLKAWIADEKAKGWAPVRAEPTPEPLTAAQILDGLTPVETAALVAFLEASRVITPERAIEISTP